jgi:formate dehydrogenase major subunit
MAAKTGAVKQSRKAEIETVAPHWETGGPVRHSTDPRDFGWVRESVPCQAACPAETNIPAYIRMISEEAFGRSFEINEHANVLPGVLGRICSRPCEDACRHGWPGHGEPVDICHLKRVAADLRTVNGETQTKRLAKTGKRIAIIGSGPAGIAAAHDLALFGHAVTLFERETTLGGMLAYGIPAFRLPRDTLAAEIKRALDFGVEVRTGTAIGTGNGDIRLADLLSDYDAVLLATGTMAAIELPLRDRKGDDAATLKIDGIDNGLDFLIDLHRGAKKKVGQRVAVIGGGFTAMDCARIARRLGAKEVINHIRTTEAFIPVWPEELAEAKREGVRIRGLRSPIDMLAEAKGKMSGVKFVRNRLGAWRAGGRRRAIPIEGMEFIEPCDTVLVCIGQKTVHDFLGVEVALDRWNNMAIDDNGMTSVPGLFAAGDYVTGASTVIEAIGHGRGIATLIDAHLVGRTRRQRVVRISTAEGKFRERADDFLPRQEMPMAPMKARLKELELEAETGFTPELAKQEAKRCYLCSLNFEIDVDNCIFCRYCIDVSPKDCIKLISGVEVEEDGSYGALRETETWNQVRAIWIDNFECIRCGACYDICPTRCISITRKELVAFAPAEAE